MPQLGPNRVRPRPELLAPAGDWESLRAAVPNGADAVYFGLSSFNARARATNFTPTELPEVMAFLHARNVRGFVALNTLIFSDELGKVAELIAAIAAAGVDAVIAQDLGLVKLIRRMTPTLAIHASTQMTLTEPRGIAFVKALGVERVVLARELTLEQIRSVVEQPVDMPVEVFVHGALCVAYSGQCLTSEALGGRSANRGQCAQACRLPYEMIVDGVKRDLGDRAYLLSPQDLAAFDQIAPLVEAGVASFKIEGRLKGGAYVAATTQTYRKMIDAAIAGRELALSRREELDLAQTFSRGFTPGFLDGVNHQKLVKGRVPKSRGVQLGKVVGFTRAGIEVELVERLPVEDLIRPGDGVVFDVGHPEENEPGGRIWQVQVKFPVGRSAATDLHVVELAFQANSVDMSAVPIGCDVYKTDDPALRKRLERSYAQEKPTRRAVVAAKLAGSEGGTLTLAFSAESGETASATWPGPLALGRSRATTTTEIRDQLSRLGDTPFELGELSIELDGEVMVPKSVLNDLRRRAANALSERLTDVGKHAVASPDALTEMRSELGGTASLGTCSTSPASLTVLVRTLEQLDAVLAWQPGDGLTRPAAVYCDFEDLRRYKDAVTQARAAGMPVGLASMRILKPGEEGFQTTIVRPAPDLILVRNLAAVGFFKAALADAELVGDFSLNVANELAADLFIREGLRRLVPSYDLNWDQFAALVRRADPAWFEPVIHQHMPMFHNEFCIFAAFLSTGKNHTDCGRPCDRHKVELRDRTGSRFPVVADSGCRNTVFNGVAQSAAEYIGRMLALGLRRFRVDLLRELPEQVGPLLEHYARVIAGREDGRETWRKLRVLNQLGVTRGTLNLH